MSVATESAEGISFRCAGSAALSGTGAACGGKTRLTNTDAGLPPVEPRKSWLGRAEGNSLGTTFMFRSGTTGGAGRAGLLLGDGLGGSVGGSVEGAGTAGFCWFCQSRLIFSRSRSRSSLILSRSLRRVESLLLNSSVTAVPSLLFRMTWGVIKKMSSVRSVLSSVVRKKRPSTGTSMRYGMPLRVWFLFSAMIPPIARLSPS